MKPRLVPALSFVNVDCQFFKAETAFFTHLSVSAVADRYCCHLSCPPKCSFSTSATASPSLEQHTALAFNVPKSEKSGCDEQNILHKFNKKIIFRNPPPQSAKYGFHVQINSIPGKHELTCFKMSPKFTCSRITNLLSIHWMRSVV